ncbi:hypothetical protein [Mesorhizobium sp. 128a]
MARAPETFAAGADARQFLIVPPRESRYENVTYRSRMEAALSAAMPGYIFTVTIEHPQQQDTENIFIEPDGIIPDCEGFLMRVMEALAPFVADKAPRLNQPAKLPLHFLVSSVISADGMPARFAACINWSARLLTSTGFSVDAIIM